MHVRIEWSQKMLAQIWAVGNSATTGAHRECRGCLQPMSSEQLKLCSRCQMAAYCCKECQASHWPTHKKECQKLSATERQAMRGRKSLGLSLGVSRSEHDIAYTLVTLPPSLSK